MLKSNMCDFIQEKLITLDGQKVEGSILIASVLGFELISDKENPKKHHLLAIVAGIDRTKFVGYNLTHSQASKLKTKLEKQISEARGSQQDLQSDLFELLKEVVKREGK